MRFLINFFKTDNELKSFKYQLQNILGFSPTDIALYKTALSHRSVREGADENNERLEFLGDAVLSSIVAHYLFRKYPYKGEGFLTEMRSKMVNRQKMNEIALKMGLKKITIYNKLDNALRISQIFGNSLEALIGAIYIDSQNFDTVKACVLAWFEDLFEKVKEQKVLKDAKSRLQELLQAHQLALPRYEVTETIGNAPNQIFVVSCQVEIIFDNKTAKSIAPTQASVTAQGESRRIAEQRCAEALLTKISDLLPPLR